jgi:hypothetical protein
MSPRGENRSQKNLLEAGFDVLNLGRSIPGCQRTFFLRLSPLLTIAVRRSRFPGVIRLRPEVITVEQ